MKLSLDGWMSSGWANAQSWDVPVDRDELPALVRTALKGLKGIRVIDVDRDGGTFPLGSTGFGGGSAIHLRFETMPNSSTRILARVTGFGMGGFGGASRSGDADRLVTAVRRVIADRPKDGPSA